MQWGYVKPSEAKRRVLAQMREDQTGTRRITGRVVVRETERAILTALPGRPETEAWLPKSQMTDVERDGERIGFTVPAWLAADRML